MEGSKPSIIEEWIEQRVLSPIEKMLERQTAQIEKMLTIKEAYTLEEIATQIGSSVSTIYNYVKAGKIQTITVGGKKVVLRKDFEDFLNERKKESALGKK